LSLGEKQRLAMARLFYHKPDYVILDECTSACAGSMERRLYRRCKEMGCSVITISHRPVLQAFHDRILTIGLGDHGYTLEDISAETTQMLLDASATRAYDDDTSSSALTSGSATPRLQNDVIETPSTFHQSHQSQSEGNVSLIESETLF
jgi:ABC-type glutathione transport system ATPase component